MRILHISKYYYPYIGGVENVCKYIVEGMPQHENIVVCFDEASKDRVDVVDGRIIYRVGSWINIARQALSPTYFSILKRAIKEFSPDIIHFHWANPFPAWVLLCVIPANVKLVIHWHMDIIKQKLIYPLIKPIERRLLKRADAIIVTSPNYRDSSLPLQAFKDKVYIAPNAIDETSLSLREGDEMAIDEIKAKYHNKPIVFFVGRHIQYKGLPYLLEAAEYVTSDCAIVIAGSGPLTEELKKKTNSDKVHFVGRVSDDELRQYDYASSVFAFPSITKNEAFGVALAEAMYAGAPAVTFTVEGSGINWVSVNGETCLEVENGNAVAYAEAIDKLLNDEELRKRLSETGKNRVREMFLPKNMLDAVEKVYRIVSNE